MAENCERSPLPFDSVLCFGGLDWWYKNQGHYDMQIMREFSRHVPVLYVNSIGMRLPRVDEGAVFVRRVVRKLASLRRGIVQVRGGFHVYSPLNVPGKIGRRFSTPLLRRQIFWALRRLDFRHPLIWVAVPTAGEVVDAIPRAGLVYQRTDRFEAFPGVEEDRIVHLDRKLKREADFTAFCATALLESERDQCRRAEFIDHGVDFDRFAAGATSPEPDDMKPIARPRAGFVGAIDEHTFDPGLFRDVVRRLPDVQFVLVGASTLPEGCVDAANVHMLGQKPYEEVWRYPGACDVLIMPWNQSPWIKGCNPIKLKEYLAAGRPVVSTDFDELRRYDGYVTVANDAEAFARGIRQALGEPRDGRVDRLQARVRDETWKRKGEQTLALLRDVLPQSRPGAGRPTPRR